MTWTSKDGPKCPVSPEDQGEFMEPRNPCVTDNDRDEILVIFGGSAIRSWGYKDEAERRTKILAAREYVEGWCDALLVTRPEGK